MKAVVGVDLSSLKKLQKAIYTAAGTIGVDSIAGDQINNKITVIGAIDCRQVLGELENLGKVELCEAGPVNEKKGKNEENKETK